MDKIFKSLVLILISTLTIIACSENDFTPRSSEEEEASNDIKSKILGDWYAQPDGWQMSFGATECTQTLWNGEKTTFNYIILGDKLTIEGWNSMSGTIKYIDNSKLVIGRDGMSDVNFKKSPNSGWSNNSNNNGNTNTDQATITKDFLCENNGYWHDKSESSDERAHINIYSKYDSYVCFSRNNNIQLHLYREFQIKHKGSITPEYVSKSIVDAWGKYEIQGSFLICEFTYVSCSGNSDTYTKYWKSGETNIKKYKIWYNDGTGYLIWELNDEELGFTQRDISNDGNSGSDSGSSNHHYPCKSCDESGKCWNCSGKGIDSITKKTCNTCHGSGKCQICQGKGYIII